MHQYSFADLDGTDGSEMVRIGYFLLFDVQNGTISWHLISDIVNNQLDMSEDRQRRERKVLAALEN